VLPDVFQRTPQETAPGRTGKGQIEARLITNADNPRGVAPVSSPAADAAS
jgi:hypothetical protein